MKPIKLKALEISKSRDIQSTKPSTDTSKLSIKSNSKKNFRENNITVNQKREELKTFGYFNDGNYLNNNNIVVNRSGYDQEDITKAVNELDCRIDNLNI